MNDKEFDLHLKIAQDKERIKTYVDTIVEQDLKIAELKQQRDAAANSALDHASKYSNIVQAITDPENQPSQYGTVTLAMHNELKQQRDELQHQLSGMTDSAKHFSNGMEYYRGLIDEAAKSIGIAMYMADDQGVHPDPLRAKLPECVAELEAELESRRSTNAGWNAYYALRQRIEDAPVVAHITEDGKVFSNGFVRDTDKPLISKEDLQG